MVWVLLISAACFGGGIFWLSRSPAGWNWQKKMATAITVLGPFILLVATCFSGQGKTNATAVPSSSIAESGQTQSAKKPLVVNPGKEIRTCEGDVMRLGKTSFDAGRATAYDPPQKFGRSTADIKVVQVGTGKWRIRFEAPGPAMIRTGLPICQGETYYIKMDKEAESLQFGWLGEDEQGLVRFAPAPAPASALVDSVPLRYTMSSWANNAQLAFNTSTIPDGKYEITVTKGQFSVKLNEYAPGVPLRNRW